MNIIMVMETNKIMIDTEKKETTKKTILFK